MAVYEHSVYADAVRILLLALTLACGADDAPRDQDPCRAGLCDQDGDGFRALDAGGADCDDNDAAVNPSALETCNGVDDDCDGLLDDDDPSRDATGGLVLHPDRDGDGFGDGSAASVLLCDAAPGLAPPGDCDDADALVNPGALERCDGRDDDCDGLVDDADPDLDPTSQGRWFADADEDGFGDPDQGVRSCRVPEGHVANAGDCDDRLPERNPRAPERCDDLPDNNCDGTDDPRELDRDGDGFSACQGDCRDTDPGIHPDAIEICNGIDDDCDGLVDEEDPSHDQYSCGWCPSDETYTSAPIVAESWNPCVLDPETRSLCSTDPERPDTHDAGQRLHRIRYRDDIPHRRELFLFFPPATGGSNNNIRMWAAWAGYKVIALGHDNSTVLKNYCSDGLEERCYTNARHEIVYGEDTSPHVDVGPADGVVRRLEVLLAHLDDHDPSLGWGAYLDPEGQVIWDDIVVSGWSRGAGTAAFLARDHRVHAQVYFSGPMDRVGDEDPDVAAWIQDERMTPGCNTYGIYHTEENNQLMGVSWDHLGVPELIVDVDTSVAPYDNAHRLTSTIYSPRREWCDYHRAIGMDECMDESLRAPYLYMMCGAAYADPEVCD